MQTLIRITSDSPVTVDVDLPMALQELHLFEAAADYRVRLDLDDKNYFPVRHKFEGVVTHTPDLLELGLYFDQVFWHDTATPFVWHPQENLFRRSIRHDQLVDEEGVLNGPIEVDIVTKLAANAKVLDFLLVVDEDDDPVRFWMGTDGPDFVHPIIELDGVVYDNKPMNFHYYLQGAYRTQGASGWNYGTNYDYDKNKTPLWFRLCRAIDKADTPEKIVVKWLNKNVINASEVIDLQRSLDPAYDASIERWQGKEDA